MPRGDRVAPGAPNINLGSVVGGKYRLLQLLAKGGMSEVWTAVHMELGVNVAIKFRQASRDFDAQGEARFRREAQTLARMRHPHLVRVHDYGIESERPFIVMELLEGETLRQRIANEGRLTLLAASDIASQAAKALGPIHEAGLVHRDITPNNIFLEGSRDEPVAKLLDFGIVKQRSEDLVNTSSGVIIGSPAFMSPEQARGHEVDHRSDLWSLGVVLFKAVTGRDAFEGSTIPDLLLSICSGDLPVATQVRGDLPAELDRFFLQALARNPDQRFQSAEQLAREFRAIAVRHADLVSPSSRSPAASPTDGDDPLGRSAPTQALEPVASSAWPKRMAPASVPGRVAVGVIVAVALVGLVVAAMGPRASRVPTPNAVVSSPVAAATLRADPERPAPIISAVASVPDQPATRASRDAPVPRNPTTRRIAAPAASEGKRSPKPSLATSGPRLDPIFGLPLSRTRLDDE
jgi:serine/threonine protein kinase